MNDAAKSRFSESVPWCAAALGGVLFAFHLLVNRQYGFHGDELYFLVCGSRPAWGYVDHPPFVPMVARFATVSMGVNLFALRFFPALALGVSCGLTGWLARRLGAGLFGEFLAALSFLCTPMLIRTGAFLNIPCFEVFFWLIAAHLLVTIEKRDEPRWWLAVGVVAGVALLNKHTTLFLGTGMVIGLVLTHRRRDLVTPWPWIGGIIAFAIFLPNLLWQYHHDWATLEFVRRINVTSMPSRVEFMLAQFILMNPFNIIVVITGLIYFFFDNPGRRYRLIGWIFITVLSVMVIFRAKVYYLLPAYPMLMAGGAVLLERKLVGGWRRIVRGVLSVAIAILGFVFLPMVAPIGSLKWKERYIGRVLGFVVEDPSDLTFDFHYQLGRPEELRTFLHIYESLDQGDRGRSVILTNEYDTASNVNVFGRAMGLPEAISGNNSYFLWGPRGATGACVIAFGYDEDLLKTCFGEVRVVAETPNPLHDAAPGRPVYVCRKPVALLETLWPRFKVYH